LTFTIERLGNGGVRLAAPPPPLASIRAKGQSRRARAILWPPRDFRVDSRAAELDRGTFHHAIPITADHIRRKLGRQRQVTATNDLNELLMRSVVDYAIYMLSPEGCVVSWNPGAERITGYTANEIIGAHFSGFYTDEERLAGVPTEALQTAADAGRFMTEAWRVRKDGTQFWAMVVIDPTYQDGRLAGFIKITCDMTEQRKAQLAALAGERSFRLLVQGVTDYAIFMLDPDGRVANWNAGAARIKGFSEAEILGKHLSSFYTQEDQGAGLPARALETARSQGRYESEGWRIRKDGTRFWASAVIDAIRDDTGTLIGFAKITRDLTERREAQLELEQSREQLFHSQKMEAIGQLTGGLAHDFNNMLTGITGSLELMKVRLAQGRVSDLERYIASAHGAASRAAALTHRLLAFARRQTLDPTPTDPNKLITSMEDMIQRTMGPAIRVDAIRGIGLWPTLCDVNQLENAILNLCINARDAMPDGGHLVIETTNTWVDYRGARERDMEPGQYVSIGVTDTGTGMPPEVLARVFDPFYTTKPIGQGTGLGLSMVYGFAKQSKGQVRIYSEMGAGTTVQIYLPRHRGTEEDETVAQIPVEAPKVEAGETVLVVDDEPSVRMLVTDVLEELGYSAIEAADGATGLKVLRSDVRVDLLITDVGLPGGLNGRQMADAARGSRPHLKVLFITGYAENAAISNGHLDPGMHILPKPFAMDRLADKIRSIVSQK
jgi:PAS domain S-box-containing protein